LRDWSSSSHKSTFQFNLAMTNGMEWNEMEWNVIRHDEFDGIVRCRSQSEKVSPGKAESEK
jgi:hypothetical protein